MYIPIRGCFGRDGVAIILHMISCSLLAVSHLDASVPRRRLGAHRVENDGKNRVGDKRGLPSPYSLLRVLPISYPFKVDTQNSTHILPVSCGYRFEDWVWIPSGKVNWPALVQRLEGEEALAFEIFFYLFPSRVAKLSTCDPVVLGSNQPLCKILEEFCKEAGCELLPPPFLNIWRLGQGS
jgi:hypothetical protein